MPEADRGPPTLLTFEDLEAAGYIMMQLFAEEVMPHFREDAHVDETAGIGR